MKKWNINYPLFRDLILRNQRRIGNCFPQKDLLARLNFVSERERSTPLDPCKMQTRVNQRRQKQKRKVDKEEEEAEKVVSNFFLTRLSRFSRETRKRLRGWMTREARCEVVEIKGPKKEKHILHARYNFSSIDPYWKKLYCISLHWKEEPIYFPFATIYLFFFWRLELQNFYLDIRNNSFILRYSNI